MVSFKNIETDKNKLLAPSDGHGGSFSFGLLGGGPMNKSNAEWHGLLVTMVVMGWGGGRRSHVGGLSASSETQSTCRLTSSCLTQLT